MRLSVLCVTLLSVSAQSDYLFATEFRIEAIPGSKGQRWPSFDRRDPSKTFTANAVLKAKYGFPEETIPGKARWEYRFDDHAMSSWNRSLTMGLSSRESDKTLVIEQRSEEVVKVRSEEDPNKQVTRCIREYDIGLKQNGETEWLDIQKEFRIQTDIRSWMTYNSKSLCWKNVIVRGKRRFKLLKKMGLFDFNDYSLKIATDDEREGNYRLRVTLHVRYQEVDLKSRIPDTGELRYRNLRNLEFIPGPSGVPVSTGTESSQPQEQSRVLARPASAELGPASELASQPEAPSTDEVDGKGNDSILSHPQAKIPAPLKGPAGLPQPDDIDRQKPIPQETEASSGDPAVESEIKTSRSSTVGILFALLAGVYCCYGVLSGAILLGRYCCCSSNSESKEAEERRGVEESEQDLTLHKRLTIVIQDDQVGEHR